MALETMQDISSLEPPGRFLMESKGIAPSTNSENDSENDDGVHPLIFSKVWLIVDHKKAMEKVLHRLRDKDPGGEDGVQPSAKKKDQKSSTLPDGSIPGKLSQNEGAEGAFAGRTQTKSSDDIVLQSSGRVNENYTTSCHRKSSDTNTRASSLSSDSPNKVATWEDITGEAMDGNTSPRIHYDDQDDGRILSNSLYSLHDECDWDVDQERDSRNKNCSNESASVGSMESMISMNGSLKSESLDITSSLGLHNGDVTWEDETGEVLDGNNSPPIHDDTADAGRRHSSNSPPFRDAGRRACSNLLELMRMDGINVLTRTLVRLHLPASCSKVRMMVQMHQHVAFGQRGGYVLG